MTNGTEAVLFDRKGAAASLRIAVGVATAARPHLVINLLDTLGAQSRKPDAIFVCAPTPGDISGLVQANRDVRVLTGVRGLTRQRNEILRHLVGFDVVIFLDDDFVPGRRYIECTGAVFATRPDVVMTTGMVLADGILGPGLELAAAREMLRSTGADGRCPMTTTDVYSAYGCNMGIRLAPVRTHGLAFDEDLPLYGWLEDVDFSRGLARHGHVLKVAAACGVHLGVKSGRQSGVRLGYSQIANPVYLVRKGTCSPQRALYLMSRNVAANLVRMLRPEPYVDRLGRALGNGRALLDFVTGRLAPSRALSL